MSSEGLVDVGEQERHSRIYEVILTEEQFRRFEDNTVDGAITLRAIYPDDVLQHCPEGMLAHFIWSEREGEVIIPGKDVAWWLNALDDIDQEHGQQPWRKPYADAYSSHPKKGYAIPIDQVEIAEPRSLPEY